MKQRQPLFSKVPILRITKIYVVLLCITITKTFATEAYKEDFSSKVENVAIINIDNLSTKQQTAVTGKVVDKKGNPIPGVTVLIKGTSIGVASDFDGNYSLDVEDSNSILVFSYLGFLSQEVTVNDQNVINITLIESDYELDEVVVIGYGTIKKVNLTGSVATIKGSDVVENRTASVSSALSGLLPGVTIIQSSGEPGADISSINIRGMSTLGSGSNSPLILVDGIPRSINNINPNDIESISVLKDAAASAIYGMRAANGVVLITTKRGKGKTTFDVNVNSGFQQPTRLPDFLDSFNYATLLNEANANDGVAPAYTDEDLQLFSDGTSPDTHPNTNWIDETLDDNSFMESIDVAASGSSENNNIKYYTSLGYLYQDALFDNNNFDRINFRSNLDVSVSENISLTTDFSGNFETRNRPSVSTSTIFADIMRTPPTEVNQYSNGGYSIFSQTPAINTNGYGKTENFDFQSKIAINIKFPFLEGLNLTTQVAYDRATFRNKSFTVPRTFTTYDDNADVFELSRPGDRGETASLSESQSQGYKLVTETILGYNSTFGKHDVGGTLIFSRTLTQDNFLSASISNMLGTSVDFFIAGDPETRSNTNGTSESGILGYAGRFTYAYDSKYLVEFNGRYDGSYKFSKDSRFGFFPSVSLGWRVSEEQFLKNSDVVNNLKLRASYGELGNDAGINAFRYLEFFGFGGAFVDNAGVVQTINSNGLADPSTTWEKAKTYNFGVELGLWKNLFTLESDVFYKRTSDILTTRALEIPDTFGATLPQENIGIVDNKGFEITLNHRNRVNDFDYHANFNIGYAKNEIIDVAEAADIDPLRSLTGRSIGTRFGFVAEGLFLTQQEIDDLNANAPDGIYQPLNPQPGDIRYADVNGDGKVDNDDRTVIGKGSIPEVSFGLNLGANYKQFDFSVLFQGATGFDMYLSEEASWAFFNGGKVFDRHLDRAQIGEDGNVINSDATYPRLTLINNAVNEQISSYWVVAGDYLRLKNIEIGYTFPEKATSQIGLDRLRLYLNGRNLTTWSKIKNLDPENPQSRGRFYPQQTVLNLGFNIQF